MGQCSQHTAREAGLPRDGSQTLARGGIEDIHIARLTILKNEKSCGKWLGLLHLSLLLLGSFTLLVRGDAGQYQCGDHEQSNPNEWKAFHLGLGDKAIAHEASSV
jgi:hypothetical protein